MSATFGTYSVNDIYIVKRATEKLPDILSSEQQSSVKQIKHCTPI